MADKTKVSNQAGKKKIARVQQKNATKKSGRAPSGAVSGNPRMSTMRPTRIRNVRAG